MLGKGVSPKHPLILSLLSDPREPLPVISHFLLCMHTPIDSSYAWFVSLKSVHMYECACACARM